MGMDMVERLAKAVAEANAASQSALVPAQIPGRGREDAAVDAGEARRSEAVEAEGAGLGCCCIEDGEAAATGGRDRKELSAPPDRRDESAGRTFARPQEAPAVAAAVAEGAAPVAELGATGVDGARTGRHCAPSTPTDRPAASPGHERSPEEPSKEEGGVEAPGGEAGAGRRPTTGAAVQGVTGAGGGGARDWYAAHTDGRALLAAARRSGARRHAQSNAVAYDPTGAYGDGGWRRAGNGADAASPRCHCL